MNVVYSSGDEMPTYLDIQSEVGITKHIGGWDATKTLHALCHLAEAQEVLEVGCGIGIGPAHLAERYRCRVETIDISGKMLHWARERAERKGVADLVAFRQADIRHLPYAADRFGAVIAESVLAFVEDKESAIRELLRVTRSGGYVGLNEAFWSRKPTPEIEPMATHLGTSIITADEWRALWNRLPLEERTVLTHGLDAKKEAADRIGWIGWRTILPAWVRVIKLLVLNPKARRALKQQLSTPAEAVSYLGYGLFSGRKPLAHDERPS